MPRAISSYIHCGIAILYLFILYRQKRDEQRLQMRTKKKQNINKEAYKERNCTLKDKLN